MGACCSVESPSVLYIDFHRSYIVKETINTKYLYPYKPLAPSLLNPSVTMQNEDSLFFIGGMDLQGTLQKLCFQISLSKRTITQYSNLSHGAYKGYSFVHEEFLYYIYFKTKDKTSFNFCRLHVADNQWEDLYFELSKDQTSQLTIKDLKTPGLAFRKNSLYLIGGYIPRAKVNSTTIFQIEFPQMNVYNLNLDLKQAICKPLAFFISDDLFIILSTQGNLQKLIQFDKDFNMIKADLFTDTRIYRPYTSVFNLNERDVVLNSEKVMKFKKDEKKLVEIRKRTENGKLVNMQVSKRGSKQIIKKQIFPLPLKMNKEIILDLEGSDHFEVPFTHKSLGKSIQSKKSKNSEIIFSLDSKSSVSTIKPTQSDLKQSEIRMIPSHIRKNDSDKVKKFTDLSFDDESISVDLGKKKLGIFDRSGKKLESLFLNNNFGEPFSRVSMPFSIAASYADENNEVSPNQILVESFSCEHD